MNYKMLGSQIEYIQASKRLEEIVNAPAGSPEALERKKLICLFKEFEKDIYRVKNQSANQKK